MQPRNDEERSSEDEVEDEDPLAYVEVREDMEEDNGEGS
jgi:hypothetical protein